MEVTIRPTSPPLTPPPPLFPLPFQNEKEEGIGGGRGEGVELFWEYMKDVQSARRSFL